MPETIAFYFDFLSPYSYLAHQELPKLAARCGCAVEYRPVSLAELKLRAGNTGPSTRDMPIKHKYARTDLARWANRYGVPLKPPKSSDSARLNRGAFFAIDRNQARDYVARAWAKTWGGGGDMADEALLAEVARELGWDAAAFLAFTVSPSADARYKASTDEAHKRGVFGVPSFVVGDEMWWGNDRMQFLEEFLGTRAKAAATA
jgi:2-hydroxychromene-2-carboxylate isomerase